MQWPQVEHAWVYITIGLVLLYALGIWLGAKGKVVVYRNYYDVMLVAGLYLLPVLMTPAFILLSGSGELNELNGGLFIVLLVLEGLLLLFILVRTVLDNLNPLKALLALYVKIPTALFFSFNLYESFTAKSGRSRRKSIFWTVFMVPVIHALVQDKKTGKLPARFSR
jgi:hypothetical protein